MDRQLKKAVPHVIKNGNNQRIYLVMDETLIGIFENPLVFLYEKLRQISELQNYYALYPFLSVAYEPYMAEKDKSVILSSLSHINIWINSVFVSKKELTKGVYLIETNQTYNQTVRDDILKKMLIHLGAVQYS